MPQYDIRERSFDFACAAVRFFQYLQQETATPRRIAEQFLSAGTAVGANLEEAKAAHSRAEFLAKNSIALKEAREARYWLRLLRACDLVPSERIDPHLQEAKELVAILTAIRKNSGHRNAEFPPPSPS
jgi:four helix bundle protein